jgi:hypothetical protein
MNLKINGIVKIIKTMKSEKRNIIVFAAGGGNDVFSALAYIKCHLQDYNKIGLVSVLGFTPLHTNINSLIEPPCIIPNCNMKRYILCDPIKEITCCEKLIPKLLDIMDLNVKTVCISPKYSAIDQAVNLSTLFDEWELPSNDTLLNVVDFGGDILTDGNQSSIISPGLDAYTLAVVTNLNNYESKLSICFPGVDGELNVDYLTNKLNSSGYKIPINVDNRLDGQLNVDYRTNKLNSSGYKIPINIDNWLEQLNIISSHVTRTGNTIPNMISVLQTLKLEDINNVDELIPIKISKHWVYNNNKFFKQFNPSVSKKLQQYIHVMDIPNDNPFVPIFNDPNYDLLNLVKHINKIYRSQELSTDSFQSCDLYLQYLRKDGSGKWTNKEIFLYQDTMIVDIFPYYSKQLDHEHETIKCFNEISDRLSSNIIKYTEYTGDQ